MSVKGTQPGGLLASYPDYALSCLYDDDDDPTEVTVFPGERGELSTTEWITADVESTVAVDEVR